MRGWLVLMLLLATPAAALTTAEVLKRDRQLLEGALADWDLFLKSNPGGEQFMAELEAFKGRTKRAKSLEEFRPIEVEFDAWKRDTAQRLRPGATLDADPTIAISQAQIGAFHELASARKQAVAPAELKAIDKLRGMVGGAQSWEDMAKLYDKMGSYHQAGVFAPRTPTPWWAGANNYRPAPFRTDVALIAAKASVPPPNMVQDQRMASYQKMVSFLTEVTHKSGLYQKLVHLGIDPLPFMLALVKSESDFRQRAVSHAGAYGFMQLLVPTAKGVLSANRSFYEQMTGQKLRTSQITGQTLLDNWKMNIIAGTMYLKGQVERFDGLVEGVQNKGKMMINLVASAYNAGEGGLTKHLLGKKSVTWSEVENVEDMEAAKRKVAAAAVDPDKSVVAYRETRGYVKKIQGWYDYWRGAWSSWAGSRVPPSISA